MLHLALVLTLGPALLPRPVDLSVSAVEPARWANFAPTAGPLAIEFDAAPDPASLPGNVHVFGRWSGDLDFEFALQGTRLELLPERPFFPGELVTVQLTNAVASTTGEPLSGGHTWSFYTRARPGSGTHTLGGTLPVRFEGEGLIQSYGIYAGDLNGDGAADFSIPNEVSSDVRVLVGDGCGGYAPPVAHALPPNSVPSSNEGADFDRDGHIDIAIANILGDTMSVLLGDGSGLYEPAVTYPGGNQPRGLCVLDFDADGDTDIAVANRSSSDVYLYANQGDGTFGAGVAFDAGGAGETAIAAVDADADGRADLYVGHLTSDSVTCALGDGAGGFSVSGGTAIGGSPWMIAVGDVDGDSVPDAATCNFDSDTAGIARGDGTGDFFAAQVVGAGDFPLAVDLGDLDGDGDLDLVVSNYSDATWSLFHNDGAGTFTSAGSLPASIAGSCATLVDHDRDGDIDVVGVDEIADVVFLYEQDSPPLVGLAPALCSGTLRVDNLAGSGGPGFPAHPVPLGGRTFLGVSGTPATAFGFVYGPPLAPALATDGGLLSVFPPTVLAGGATDGFGEGLVRVDVPPGLPAGLQVAVQAFLLDPGPPAGLVLTNPETLELVP